MIFIVALVLYILGYIENKIYPLGCPPIVAFFGPITFLLLICNILEKNASFFVYNLILLVLILIWFLIGIISYLIFFKCKQKKYKIQKIYFVPYMDRLVFLFLFLSTLKTVFIFGWQNTKGNAGGILAHLFILFSPFYFFMTYIKNIKVKKILLLMSLILLFLHPKYESFLFFLPLILYKFYRNKTIFKFKNIVIFMTIGFGVFSVFFCTYYINFKVKGLNVDFKEFSVFIINHIKYYVLSPLYIGKYFLLNPNQGDKVIPFSPFINITKVIIGNKDYINPILPFVNYGGISSNVGGIIPELVYNIGNIGMYIYVSILGIITYIIENLFLKNRIWICTNLILKSTLFLCFFNNVYSVLGYVERVLGSLFITLFLILYQKLKSKRRKHS
ncbi:hypothetical protein IX329_002485 [Fusobacterium necrophorum]|nr:O-antigen polymerase [Fusobacterium necrophorum]MBR8734870.1 hypothetical protein [Fusobacterium necrophorum]MBR8791037.1 hypothetical protein [Fusobacterium necrophorum]